MEPVVVVEAHKPRDGAARLPRCLVLLPPQPFGKQLKISSSRVRNIDTGQSYGTSGEVVRVVLSSLDELETLLTIPAALDRCYRLNAEMMRRGPSMYRRFHNPWLAEEILTI
jgi:hypothetical protein